jgi:hypothetical protein
LFKRRRFNGIVDQIMATRSRWRAPACAWRAVRLEPRRAVIEAGLKPIS